MCPSEYANSRVNSLMFIYFWTIYWKPRQPWDSGFGSILLPSLNLILYFLWYLQHPENIVIILPAEVVGSSNFQIHYLWNTGAPSCFILIWIYWESQLLNVLQVDWSFFYNIFEKIVSFSAFIFGEITKNRKVSQTYFRKGNWKY